MGAEYPEWKQCGLHHPGFSDDVHVWNVFLDGGHGDRAFESVLNAAELDRSNRIRVPLRRQRYIAARALLRIVLAVYLDCSPGTIRFEYGKLGKPRLSGSTGPAPVTFNATDCGAQALFAISCGPEVGVDLELVPRDVNHARLSERYFARPEHQRLARLADHVRGEAFLACWTRKEAFGKAEGVGVRYPLDLVCMCEDLASPRQWLPRLHMPDTADWRLIQFVPPYPGIAAVVVQGLDAQVRCFSLAETGDAIGELRA